jgi:hypothetical protein
MKNAKEITMKKLYNVNSWIDEARNKEDWVTYAQALKEYARLLHILAELDK